MLNRLLRGGLWAITGRVSSAFFGLCLYSLIAHLLSPEEMGSYFLIYSLISITVVLAQFGFTQTIVRLIAESIGTGRPGRALDAICLIFKYFALSTSIVACFFAFGFGKWLSIFIFKSLLMTNIIGIAMIWMVVVAFEGLFGETFRGFDDIRFASIFGGLLSTIISVLLFGFIWMKDKQTDLKQLLTLMILSSFLSNLIAGILVFKKSKLLKGNENIFSQEIFSIAFPLLITNLTLFALIQLPILILGAYRSQEEVALYGAAVRFVSLLEKPLLIINAVVPPLIAEMYFQNKNSELERVLRITASIATIPAVLILIVFLFYGKSILGIVYGEYYSKGAIILIILSIGQIANVYAGSCGITLMMTGYQTMMMKISLLCGFITAFGSILFVKNFGAIGIACVATTTLIMQNLLMLIFTKRKLGIWTYANFSFSLITKIFD